MKVILANKPVYWQPGPRADGRMEWVCPHGIGHGNHDHGCDGCCTRSDYPGLTKSDNEVPTKGPSKSEEPTNGRS